MPKTEATVNFDTSDRAPSDAVLVERTRGGEPEAFGQLVGRYEKRLIGVIGRMIFDRELTRDIAQEAFLRVECVECSGKWA